jgi:hypothetical protein
MIYCKELNKEFENKADLFKALAENENFIIDAKKSQVYKAFEKGLQVVSDQKTIEKAFDSAEKGIKFDSDYYYFVVNSANYLDSHNDMHVDGNWNKSVKDQSGKVYLVWHHDFSKTENIIAFPEDIEMITSKVAWSLLGKAYEGETYSLIYKVKKEKIVNENVSKWLKEGRKLQLSVRMQYIKLETAFNSDDTDYIKQTENFNKYYPLIANKDEFKEIEYFFIVKEAKNVMESSLLPFGSNSATAEISQQENKTEAEVIITSEIKEEQSNDTQKQEELLKELLNKFKK